MSQPLLVAAALELLQERGLDALSTRVLAERLGVQAPALYWHVHNKEALLGLVADQICARMQLPARALPFRDRLTGIGSEYRRILLAHRDAPRLFAEQAPLGPHRFQLYEEAVSAFLDRGFPLDEAVAMATFYRHFLLGMVTEEARQGEAGSIRASAAAVLGSDLAKRDTATDYPLLHRAAAVLSSVGGEQLFTTGLNVLLDGMECRAASLSASAGGVLAAADLRKG
ncbi:MAG TPA: TetR/AcrR family transcriptional regulator C-terminal domain-containing protein [Stenotrophomonas sp.]